MAGDRDGALGWKNRSLPLQRGRWPCQPLQALPLCAPKVCNPRTPPGGVLGGWVLHHRTVSGESWAVEQTGGEVVQECGAFRGGEPLLLWCLNCKEPGGPLLSARSGVSQHSPEKPSP